jgi:3-oxoacyl-[acyl-carrier protein] reductase
MSIDGKIALVTGASRGIGLAIADMLAAQGAFVIGTATTDAGAQAIEDRLQQAFGKGAGRSLNVASADDVEAVLSAIAEQFGPPEILVNNAGITQDGLILRMKEESWEQVLNTNLTSVYRLSKWVLKGMTKARWGRIINISSVVASMGNAGQTNYAAAKAGMEGFSRSLAKEIGSRGITVNVVAPGFIETDMTRELSEEQKSAMLNLTALRRLGKPEEIAAVVAFLASEAGGYVTGEVINVNGGLYMA